jgi:hypothetical protein
LEFTATRYAGNRPNGAGRISVNTPGLAGGIHLRVLALLLSAIAVCMAAATIRVIPYGRAFWDFLFILDGAYRIGLGQTPHLDFIAPIGSLTLYLIYLAERLFPGGQPFVGLHALMWLLLVPSLAMLAPRFETGVRFCCAVALLGLMVLIPYTVDRTSLWEISYFASYNRFAVGILFLVGLWCVLPKSPWDAPLLGYLVGLLFFLKITTAAAAIGLLIATSLLHRARWRPVGLGLAGLAVTCVLIEASSGFLSAYMGDVLFMVRINQGHGIYALGAAVFRNWAPLMVGTGIAVLGVPYMPQRRAVLAQTPGQTWRLLQRQAFPVDTVVLLAAALAAESQNTGGIGLVAASAVLFHPDIKTQSSPRLIGTTLLGASLLLPILDVAVSRTLTMIYHERTGSYEHSFNALAPGIRVPASTLAGAELFQRLSHEWLELIYEVQRNRFNVDNDPSSNAPAAVAAWSEDVVEAAEIFHAKGLEAAARHYAALAFANPFPRLLGLTPAQGVSLAIEVNRTIPVFEPQEASRYIAGADGLFVFKCALSASGEPTIRMVFQPVLDTEFEQYPLNTCWDFYRRRQASPFALPQAQRPFRSCPDAWCRMTNGSLAGLSRREAAIAGKLTVGASLIGRVSQGSCSDKLVSKEPGAVKAIQACCGSPAACSPRQ